jgi:hypothetical protein
LFKTRTFGVLSEEVAGASPGAKRLRDMARTLTVGGAPRL